MFKLLADIALNTTIKSAISCYPLVGKKDPIEADFAATSASRNFLNSCPEILGTVVIGEGERDEAPMLYRGEKVGKGEYNIDIAIDPLEGTTPCAYNLPGAMTVLAMTESGGILSANDVYMQKLATAINVPEYCLDIDLDLHVNIHNLSNFLKIPVHDIGVTILNRPRHAEIIEEAKKIGVNLMLIEDCDINAILDTFDHNKTGRHLYLGTGGAPEGILAAAALKTLGGFMQGIFLTPKKDERQYPDLSK